MIDQKWDTTLYDNKHSFVYKFGEDLLDLLSPKQSERILDVGCGTGHLTAKIAERGATVIGLDNSAEMIATAQKNYPRIEFVLADVADEKTFKLSKRFDSIFSNATLHWVENANNAVKNMSRLLKPNGRFVVEFGGKGNVEHIQRAVKDALCDLLGACPRFGWYFPSVGEYASLLEEFGFEVNAAWLFDRPTPLEGEEGLRNWIKMFGSVMFFDLDDDIKKRATDRAVNLLREKLYRDGSWFADYRRIRIVATKSPQQSHSER
jgi:trans-aconitate 2-methyltransferase